MQSILFRGMFRYEDTHLEIIFSHDFMSSCYLTWLILICNEVVRSFIARECRKIFRIPRKFQVNSLKLGIDGISKKVNNRWAFLLPLQQRKCLIKSPPNGHVHIRGKKCSFFGKFGVLCFLETLILRFALLPYYRRSKEVYFGLRQTSMMESFTKIVNGFNRYFLP